MAGWESSWFERQGLERSDLQQTHVLERFHRFDDQLGGLSDESSVERVVVTDVVPGCRRHERPLHQEADVSLAPRREERDQFSVVRGRDQLATASSSRARANAISTVPGSRPVDEVDGTVEYEPLLVWFRTELPAEG